jgi:hypothetical protein
MSRCFWEERLSGVSIYKNDILFNHFSVTLTVGPHLETPYGFWQHINYCKAIKVIKNVESNSVGVKSLLGSCDIK